MNRILLLLVLIAPAHAADVTIAWDWPAEYCDGSKIDPADIEQAEIYIDTKPITASSDIERDSCAGPADIPPPSAVLHSVETPEKSVTVQLDPGTYFVRMRSQVSGRWSNLSAEAKATVDPGQPKVPVIISID